MAVQRLPRNTRVNPARAAWMISGDRKARFEQLAAAAGVSAGVFLEHTIDHLEDELTDRGLPNWWPAPEPNENELPIDTA